MCLRKSDRSAVAQDHKGHGHPSSPAISPFLLVTITLIIKSTEHKIYFSDNFYRWYHFSSCLMYTLQIIFIYDISFFSLCVCVHVNVHTCVSVSVHTLMLRPEEDTGSCFIALWMSCSIQQDASVNLEFSWVATHPRNPCVSALHSAGLQVHTAMHRFSHELCRFELRSLLLHTACFPYWAICSAFWLFFFFFRIFSIKYNFIFSYF